MEELSDGVVGLFDTWMTAVIVQQVQDLNPSIRWDVDLILKAENSLLKSPVFWQRVLKEYFLTIFVIFKVF